jgi:hypothetical protein
MCSEYIFEVQDLLTLQHALIHGNRLKFYADSEPNVSETLLDTVSHNDPQLNTVVKLVYLRFNADKEQYEVQAKWRGFDYEDPIGSRYRQCEKTFQIC